MTEAYRIAITREALRIAGQYLRKSPFTKAAAIHEIKCQPFFGEYWPKTPTDTITIRRPQLYKRDGQWIS